jgi:hypothetical protein
MEWTPSMSQWHLKYVYLTIWVCFCTPSTISCVCVCVCVCVSVCLTHSHTHTHTYTRNQCSVNNWKLVLGFRRHTCLETLAFHEPIAPKICISHNLGLFLHPFNNFVCLSCERRWCHWQFASLSLSLSHTHTHTWNQCSVNNGKLVQTHVFGDTVLPLSSSTHDHQQASHRRSESSVKSGKHRTKSLEFGPKEGEIQRNKNLQKSTLAFKFGRWGVGGGEVVKCSHPP